MGKAKKIKISQRDAQTSKVGLAEQIEGEKVVKSKNRNKTRNRKDEDEEVSEYFSTITIFHLRIKT